MVNLNITPVQAAKLMAEDASLTLLTIDQMRFLGRLVTIENEGRTAEIELVARIAG